MRSILQYFQPSLRTSFCLFLIGHLRQVLLYFLKFSVSGCTDYYAETEQEGFQMGRDAVAGFNLPDPLGPQLEPCEPIYDPGDLEGLIPARDQHLMDIHQVFFSARYNVQTLSGDKNSSGPLIIKSPVGRVLWEELLILSCFTLKSEGETSIF